MKMTNELNFLSAIALLVTLTSAPALASTIDFTVNSEGVKMYEVVKKDSVKKFEEMKAPWKIEVTNDESRLFVFEKPGCIPVYVPIYFEPGRNIEINIAMKKMDGETKTQMTVPALALADELVDQIIFTQHLIDEKKYAAALDKSEQLYFAHPQSVSVKILYGNALLMSKQYQKADSVYATVLGEVPEDKTSIRQSIESLRKKVHAARSPTGADRVPANKGEAKP